MDRKGCLEQVELDALDARWIVNKVNGIFPSFMVLM